MDTSRLTTSYTRKIFDVILLIGLIYIGYTHQAQLFGLLHIFEHKVAPCAEPVTYSIGTIDSRFGISKDVLEKDIKEAETIWETPSTKNLFQYATTSGAVTINIVYDERQAATDKLKSLGINVENTHASYDTLKSKYDALTIQITSDQKQYTNKVSAYKNAEQSYLAEVKQTNQHRGTPKAEYDRLQSEKDALDQQYKDLKVFEASLNKNIDTLNALATTINQLIKQLHINVAEYNQTGASEGEFEEGVYKVDGGIQTIDIYEYSNHIQLVRVLAHELGHALGLQHVDDSQAIMYKINSATSLKATSADITELNKVCSI